MNTTKDIIIGRAFAFGAALSYAVGFVLVRQGVAGKTSPLIGAAISLLSGALIIGINESGRLNCSLMQKKSSILFFLLAGVTSLGGVLSSYFALSMTPVVVVTPLQNTHPLFALLCVHLFMSRLERINFRLVLGTIFVVIGITMITIGKGS